MTDGSVIQRVGVVGIHFVEVVESVVGNQKRPDVHAAN